MTHVHFHCSSTGRVLVNYREVHVHDLAEARAQAAQVVRALIAAPGPEDWRDWMLHANDDLGEPLFALPFAEVIGPLH
jgi:hypothetical protein